jgi:hypothetical protein
MRRSWLPIVRRIFESRFYGKNADQISYSDSQQLLSLRLILVHKWQMDLRLKRFGVRIPAEAIHFFFS